MKKFMNQPVVWLLAAAVAGGALTPVLAEASSTKILASSISETEGFLQVDQEIKDGKMYVKGKVGEDITKVVILLPNDSRIEISSFTDQTFTAAIPASDKGEYVTLLAYNQMDLVDTVKVRIADGEVNEDALAYAFAQYNHTTGKLKVSGIVHPDVDEVVIRYGDKKHTAKIINIWEGAKSFELLLDVEADDDRDAVIELYKDDELVSEQKVEVAHVNDPVDVNQTATITGSAVLSAKNKKVELKGQIMVKGTEKPQKWKLYAIAPDGKKHELKLKKDFSFEGTLPYHNRSYSSKSVRVELYADNNLVAKADMLHGTPVNQPAEKPEKPEQTAKPNMKHGHKHKEKHEDKHKDKGKAKGKHKDKHDDDDDDDDDEGGDED